MNKVTLIGRLTKDPETRYTQQKNIAVTNFTLAVNRRFKKDEADFLNVTAWDKTAEFIQKHFIKGQQVAIVGRIETGNYEKDGVKVYTTTVIAEECYFADSKKDSNSQQQVSQQQSPPQSSQQGFTPLEDEYELPF